MKRALPDKWASGPLKPGVPRQRGFRWLGWKPAFGLSGSSRSVEIPIGVPTAGRVNDALIADKRSTNSS